ncbi:DNA gyrase inhibitor YacG [Hyphobacterium sp. HN65]|uniref:DNA gyrase inhibitor YacG n=1 Tax=Hyphobacterium lacteum TaxID=3116575 RepID=A0ABU7LTH9_9PROT|nr:DNA gyrase inhibitor YacG [Hyphobacterium sp. HN65]MEE2527213.1 DNA gyrase inhibitor YacG [Hyphobacterium sp. HN65]
MTKRKIACPICKKPAEENWLPFCSKRCADADLGHWLSDDYAIPGEPVSPAPEDPSAED